MLVFIHCWWVKNIDNSVFFYFFSYRPKWVFIDLSLYVPLTVSILPDHASNSQFHSHKILGFFFFSQNIPYLISIRHSQVFVTWNLYFTLHRRVQCNEILLISLTTIASKKILSAFDSLTLEIISKLLFYKIKYHSTNDFYFYFCRHLRFNFIHLSSRN